MFFLAKYQKFKVPGEFDLYNKINIQIECNSSKLIYMSVMFLSWAAYKLGLTPQSFYSISRLFFSRNIHGLVLGSLASGH